MKADSLNKCFCIHRFVRVGSQCFVTHLSFLAVTLSVHLQLFRNSVPYVRGPLPHASLAAESVEAVALNAADWIL